MASVAGFDIGDAASTVAVARKRGIDVLLNKESSRETPAVIAFGPKQRQLGTDAVGALAINPRNTVTQVKRLLGKPFKAIPDEISKLPYTVIEGPDGGCLVEVEYLGERTTFTPEQLVAMLIVDEKAIAEADGSPVTDCVISVPVYFTERERYAMLNAAQIANVNCLRLLNDTTSIALAYGIFKTDLPETDPVTVAFVDIGHSSLQVSIVAFKKGQLRVLSHSWDRNLGGRNFDEVLFDYFVEEFGQKHKIDIRSNLKASFRLRQACEKLKKVLSANAEAPLNVECLMNDVDVRGMMSRDKFEELAKPVIARIQAPLAKALADAKISLDQISSVEVTGGTSRVPSVITELRDFFKKEPSRTLNAKESVSRGCALNCAMLSPIFRVRDFEVIDSFPFGTEFTWEKDGEPTTTVLFERNGPIPSAKMLTFFRNSEFTLSARYTNDSEIPEGFDRHVGTFVIGPPKPAPGSDKAKLKVKIRLNLHGVISVESVQQIDEEEYEETVPKAATKVQKDEKMADTEPAKPDSDEKMEEASAQPEAAPGPEANGTAPAAGTAPMDTEAKAGEAAPAAEQQTEVIKKRRTRKSNVDFKSRTAGLDNKTVQNLIEAENEMAMTGKLREETNARKNELEAYIYALRNKLHGPYADYVQEEDKAGILDRLEKMEDWLYEDGEDETKSVYTAKLDELKKVGEPIAQRAAEVDTRAPAASALLATAHNYMNAASSSDPKLAHISAEERAKVTNECQKAVDWLESKQQLQGTLSKTEDPVLLTSDIKKKEDTLNRYCDPILSKPAPAPKKEEKKEEAKEGEKQEEPVKSEVEVEEMETDAPAEAKPAGEAGLQHNLKATRQVRTQAATLESKAEPALEKKVSKKESPAPAKAPTAKPVAVEETVLLQGFGWSSCDVGGWYNIVKAKIPDIKAAGFTHIWLPPPSQSVSRQGYLPGQLYNLESKYGSKEELKALNKALAEEGIVSVADIVINHRCADQQGPDGIWNDFGDDVDHNGKPIDWGQWAITGDDPEFNGSGNPDTGDDYGPAPDLDHLNVELRKSLIDWLNWLKNDIGFAGWRFDFVKGYGAEFTKEYVEKTVGNDKFNVGEYWVDLRWGDNGLEYDQNGPRQTLCDWLDAAGGTTLFDFVSKGILTEAIKNNEYWRLIDPEGRQPGLTGWWPTKSVTFIDNHDTGSTQQHWPFPSGHEETGYAYIMTHPGMPSVLYEHYFDNGFGDSIKKLIEIRQRNGINAGSKLEIKRAQADIYVAEVDNKLVVKLGPNQDMGDLVPKEEEGWKIAATGNNFAIWEKSGN
ncbi:hypothetical protein WJX72_010520 [[Myrmecia] bisecta]|uniref:alpha-amylase n=1 Tax=[Myrmecia] bisecta TaxID=41462 RepID=A0AAW1R8U6_9CHLO